MLMLFVAVVVVADIFLRIIMAKIIVKDQKNQRRRFAFTHKEAFFYFYRYNSPSFHNKLLSIDHDDTTITTITIQ